MTDTLFPVACPTCGAPVDHDGVGRCSTLIATLRARIAELEEACETLRWAATS